MRKSQSNYLNMLNAVLRLLDDNRKAWEDKIVIQKGYDNLNETVTEINNNAVKQTDNNPKGHTAAKEDTRNELEDLVYVTVVRIRSYARMSNNTALLEKMKFSRSDFSLMKTNDLLSVSRMIAEVCNSYQDSLTEYEAGAETAKTILTLAEQTRQLYALRDTVIDQRMEATERMTTLFAQARHQLKMLDDLIEGFTYDDTFASAYFKTRRIHDLKGGGKKSSSEEK